MATETLTDKLILSTSPPPGRPQVVLRDDKVPGFIAVVGARTRTYYLEARVGGAHRKMQIGRHGVVMPDGRDLWNVPRARAKARSLLGQVAEGRDPAPKAVPASATGPTLREGLTLHIDNLRKRRKSERTVETYEGDIKRHLADWLDRPLVELTALELDKLHKSIRASAVKRAKKRGGAPRAFVNSPGDVLANRIVRHVKAIWNATDRVHELPGRNPARGVVPVEEAPRDARVATDEFPEWWAAIHKLKNPVRRDVYILGLLTGVRSEGIRNTRVEDFDPKTATLRVTHAKGSKPYTIPLGPRAVALLEARIADNATRFEKHGGPRGWLFPGFKRARRLIGGKLRREVVAMPGARDRDKVTGDRLGVPLHDLRRTYNSIGKEVGVPLEVREALMNHTSRATNDVHYSRPDWMGYLAGFQRRIEAALFERIERTE